MTRKDFYTEYYTVTNRIFCDKFVWSKQAFSKEAWQKGQISCSKLERKIFMIFQYICLVVCWIPMCFDHTLWIIVPIGISISLLCSLITDFSLIKMEALYQIYNSKTVYCRMLYEVFQGNWSFLDQLKRLTKRVVLGFNKKSGGKFFAQYCAVCRNKSNSIMVNFKIKCVEVKVNDESFTINKSFESEEEMILEIASVINNSPYLIK